MPVAVTAEVPIGLVVVQVRVVLQLLAPAVIVQEEVAGVRVPDIRAKVAVRLLATVMEVVQVPVPEQAPVQPVNDEPVDGVAVRVTEVL